MKAFLRYSEYALKAGDFYNYVRGKEFIGVAYFSLGDTAKSLSIFQGLHQSLQQARHAQGGSKCLSGYNKYIYIPSSRVKILLLAKN